MAELFPRWCSTAIPLIAIAGVCLAGLVVVGLIGYVRTPYVTEKFVVVEQPVMFDHRHHVRDDGIDCEYCHATARFSPTAGMPSARLCMGCHAQIWNNSPLLIEVRRAYFFDQPIRWQRVHDLPDFVFFNHSVHVENGVACSACHGSVENMALAAQVSPLTMGWCLDCHRQSIEAAVPRPTRLTTCSACHR